MSGFHTLLMTDLSRISELKVTDPPKIPGNPTDKETEKPLLNRIAENGRSGKKLRFTVLNEKYSVDRALTCSPTTTASLRKTKTAV